MRANDEPYLEHFGVIGMRWGRRKSPEQMAAEKQKKLKKAQDKWDKERKSIKNRMAAYSRAADYANNILIPSINKKYGKYDWSSLDTSDPYHPKGDKKLARAYKRYINEYDKSFNNLYAQSYTELFGKRPE